MTTIVFLTILAGILLASSPLRFADSPAGGGAGGGEAGGGAGGGEAGGAAGGGEAGGSEAGGGEAGGQAGGAEGAAKAAAGAGEPELTEYQRALGRLDPETAQWLWEHGEELSKKEDAAQAAAAAKGKERPPAARAGDPEYVKRLEDRLEAIEGQLSTADKQNKMHSWVAGVSEGVAKDKLAEGLEKDELTTLTQLAMGHGALARQLDAGKAVESFVSSAGPLIEKMVETRSIAKLEAWKREFLAGKLVAVDTKGEGAAAAAPERGEEGVGPNDLKDGKVADRARRRARMRVASQ